VASVIDVDAAGLMKARDDGVTRSGDRASKDVEAWTEVANASGRERAHTGSRLGIGS
jgi:hypothetical protein